MDKTRLTYPVARRDDTTDDYFGTEVADPYRWLEDDRSDETVSGTRPDRRPAVRIVGLSEVRDSGTPRRFPFFL